MKKSKPRTNISPSKKNKNQVILRKKNTQRKQVEEQIRRKNTLLDGINKIFQEALICETDIDVANKCLTVVEELTGSKLGFINELTADGQMNGITVSDPGWEACQIPKAQQALLFKNMEIRGFRAQVIREGLSIIINNPDSHPERIQMPHGHPRITSFLGVPLKQAGRIVGMIGLANKETGYTKADQEDVETLSVAFVEALQRKRAEAALSQSEERYRKLVETSPDAIGLADLNGNIIIVNMQMLSLFGIGSANEMLGKSIFEFIHPEDHLFALDLFLSAVTSKDIFNVVFPMQKQNGSRFWAEIRTSILTNREGNPYAIMVVMRDVTERRHAEETLRRHADIINQVHDSVVATDMDGYITSWNQGAQRLFGHTPEEAIGKHISFIYPEDQHKFLREEVIRPLKEKGAHEIEVLARNKSGDPIHVHLSLSLLRDSTGSPIGMIGYSLDVTPRKRLEQQIIQMQKMDAIGKFAGGVAHDFNNVLTVIMGYSELLLRELPKDDPHRPKIVEILRSGDRAASLIQQLLAFSRKQVLIPKVLNLNEVVTDIEKMLKRLISKDVHLITILDPTLGLVKADAVQIQQVIMNLVINARDAMPGGGTITIETSNMEYDEDLLRSNPGIHPGSYVVFSLSDTGYGMDAETQSHIFEPFFTTKEIGRGTGLGLSTVYGIVTQSGGVIRVFSEPGKGTMFRIYLPRIDEETLELHPEASSLPFVKGQETVLLVEDDDGIRTMLRGFLQAGGYLVIEANGGKEALDIARRHNGPIHLVVTDIVMPAMSGQELIRTLTALNLSMKVLYISGYSDRAVAHHGVLEDGTAFLQKPFKQDLFLRKVRELLDVS